MHQALEIAVGSHQNRRQRGLVKLPALDAEHAIFDDVAAADAVGTADPIELAGKFEERDRGAVELRGHAGLEAQRDHRRLDGNSSVDRANTNASAGVACQESLSSGK